MINAGEKLIEVKDLKKNFGSLEVLKGINETIHKGEVVSIIGPSGSGKSTFLRCLNLLEKPTSGQVIFEGVDIADKKINIDHHRQKIGMVFQHFNVFPHLTVLENITITPTLEKKVPQKEAEEKAAEEPSAEEQTVQLLQQIRDELAKQNAARN